MGNPPAHALRAGEDAGADAADHPSPAQTSRFTHAADSCLPRDDHVSRRWSESFATSTYVSSPEVGMPLAMISAGTGAWVSVRHLCAGPLAADVALYREYARCVVQLLADALERTAARAASVLGLVVAVHARQVRRQGGALRHRARRSRRLLLAQQFLELRLSRGKVGVQSLVEQRALFGIELLALLAELQASQRGYLERELRRRR